jgi:hypothetical protein
VGPQVSFQQTGTIKCLTTKGAGKHFLFSNFVTTAATDATADAAVVAAGDAGVSICDHPMSRLFARLMLMTDAVV